MLTLLFWFVNPKPSNLIKLMGFIVSQMSAGLMNVSWENQICKNNTSNDCFYWSVLLIVNSTQLIIIIIISLPFLFLVNEFCFWKEKQNIWWPFMNQTHNQHLTQMLSTILISIVVLNVLKNFLNLVCVWGGGGSNFFFHIIFILLP